eukprot:gene10388-11469_t
MEDLITPSFVDDESILNIISALEEDKDVEKKFEKEVIDVPTEVKNNICEICSAVYKTTTGLKRHTNMKHKKVTLTETDIKLILNKSCLEIAQDECYGKEINAKFHHYYETNCFDASQFVANDFFNIVDNLCFKLSNSKKKENFFSDFYGQVALKSSHFFPEMEGTEASLLAINICQKQINEVEFHLKPPTLANSSSTLTERGLSAIECLAGYVIRKIFYQEKKHSSKYNEIDFTFKMKQKTSKIKSSKGGKQRYEDGKKALRKELKRAQTDK